MGTKTKNRTALAFTSSDALLFDYIRKVELRLMRLERYDRARNVTANREERSAREIGGGIKFDHPGAAENARAAPSVKRRDHLVLFAFARVVDDEESCHLLRALTHHAWRVGARHRRFSRPQSYRAIDISPPCLSSLVLKG